MILLQPSLNCEELDAELGLELRWTFSEDKIILQLVSSTGNDRYLALGIRDPTEAKGIAGDVVVGWISTSTGKGGLDDYFLAGKHIPCDDGAESCPDKSKGGTKDIELLNAVSRANYTMLTVQRPIKAKGKFDIDVLLDQEQFIFWSVGYKSAAMRKKNKPLKNLEPIGVNFGREPLWNCLKGPAKYSNSNQEATRKPSIDLPRRRMSMPSILTPPVTNERPLPSPFQKSPIMTTRRPVMRRPRPTMSSRVPQGPKKKWSNWSNPQNQQGPKNGGLTPDRVANVKTEPLTNHGWNVPNIGCGQTSDGPLYLHLGPATPNRGNQGLGPDGTALYVNGLLAPEITLQRGKEYTFVVETGLGSDLAETFHPVYFTSDSAGGRQFKTEMESRMEKVYAGVAIDSQGKIVPSVMGKLCRWVSPRPVMTYATFMDFHRSLELKCESVPTTMSNLLRSSKINNPSVLRFIPDNTMPDEIFYQSFMGKSLGSKVHITDYCYNSKEVPKNIVTFRPTILEHMTGQTKGPQKRPVKGNRKTLSEMLSRSETRKRPGPIPLVGNRRMDEDAFDYDYNSYDFEKDMINKCTRRSRVKGRSLDDNSKMPKFEHFPMRDIIRSSGLDEELPTEEECRQFVKSGGADKPVEEKENVFKSLMKLDRSNFGGKINPNQQRVTQKTTTTEQPMIRTTPVLFAKTRSPSPSFQRTTKRPLPTFMTTATTKRPKYQETPSTSWNTARPGFNSFQLDPSLLHNGFLFDKRQMETKQDLRPDQRYDQRLDQKVSQRLDQRQHQMLNQKLDQLLYQSMDQNPSQTTARPSVFRATPTPISYSYQSSFRPKLTYKTERPLEKTSLSQPRPGTFKPRLTTSTTMPTLPPPGGDLPAYLTYLKEAEAQYEDKQIPKKTLPAQPPILKKIPVPISLPQKEVKPSQETPAPQSESNPFSMFSGMFMPNWFQETTTSTTTTTQAPPAPKFKPKKKIPQLSQISQTQTKRKNKPFPKLKDPGLPLLPPPRDFPSYEKAKRKSNKRPNKRPNKPSRGQRYPKRPGPPKRALPKSTSAKIPVAGNYADFVQKEFQKSFPTKPPVQFIPRNKPNLRSPYQVKFY